MDGEAPPIRSGEDVLEAMRGAHAPALAAALAQLTGDLSFIEAETPAYTPFGDEQGGLSEAFRERLALAAHAALLADEAGRPRGPPPVPARVRRLMDYVAGAPIPERYAPFLLEELGLDGVDPRRPRWEEPELTSAAAGMSALVVGAGMSGLLAAIRLKEAGLTVQVVEKNADLGGTWLENVYPGCRVDVPNHLYSYSFAGDPDWPDRYSRGPVLLDYFRRVADRHGLRPLIRFNTKVLSARWDETAGLWTTRVRAADGEISEIVSTVVIFAMGQLNQPKLPELEGLGAFAGESFHSARWPAGFSASGRRIAVIGTGASAFQFVPEIAPEAKSLTVFQRTPPWLAPTPDYHDPVGDGQKLLVRRMPFYDRWYRFHLFWSMTDGVLEAVRRDPDWRGDEGAVGAANAMLRHALIEVLKPQLEGRQDLLAKVIPAYPFGAKRALRDNGRWIAALRRENVTLETTAIKTIRAEGVETADGVLHPADVLIFGTGFSASAFLNGVEITGRGGRELHEVWDGDARAFLGILAPGFPNLFTLYGPNTNIVVNGSIIFFSECATRYVLGCLELLARTGARSLEVKQDVHDSFNARVDEANAAMAWGAPGVMSWYKNAKGRVSQNWPFPLVDYWSATLKPRLDDLVLTWPEDADVGA
jgi:4-hydroxyacetophenone monooxygenase